MTNDPGNPHPSPEPKPPGNGETSQEHPTPRAPEGDPGLPPVNPPTGSMIMRLFLVPGLIVAGLVLLFLAGPTLSRFAKSIVGLPTTGQDPEVFLRKLDNSNDEVRWRAASDLAQVLLRDDQLATNASFALELASRLEQAQQEKAEQEKESASYLDDLSLADRPQDKTWKEIQPKRNLVMFLIACMGNFRIPAGVPVLEELALQTEGMEWRALAQQRRQAVWALANLGENLNRYDKLPEERKDEIEIQLEELIENNRHQTWAEGTLEYLQRRRKGKQNTFGVAEVLIRCSEETNDPSLRAMSAFAMNFWWGTAKENNEMEDRLLELTSDDGRGESKLNALLDENLQQNPAQTKTRIERPGFRVQSNAVIALAHRGSPKVRLPLMEEMLQPEALREIFILDGTQATRRNASLSPFSRGSLLGVLVLVGIVLGILFGRWWIQKPLRWILGVASLALLTLLVFVVTTEPPAQAESNQTQVTADRVDEAAVVQTVIRTMKAVEQLHQRRPQMKLTRIRKAIDQLREHPNPAIQNQANETYLALNPE